jgi:RNA polymerase sigma factor (sigma-70 family)
VNEAQEQESGSPVSTTYEERKKLSTKQRIVSAYEKYKRKEPGSGDHLMVLVRDFAYSKLRRLDFDLSSGAEDADDFAQDVVMAVWSNIDNHRGETGESFYSWVHRIAFNRRSDGFNELLREKQERMSLTHEVTEGDEIFEHDNLEVYENAALVYRQKWSEKDTDGNVLWEFDDEVVPGSETSQFDIGVIPVHIPDWVRGENLTICNLVLRGTTYKEVGKILGITEKAVARRLETIRQRVAREKAEAA